MTRVSPPELARAWPGPHASTSVTCAPRRRSSSAVQPPNAPAPTTTTRGTLEVELHAELHLARRERRGNRPEGARRPVAVRGLEVRVVEEIERLDARFETPLAQAERLVQPEI